MSTLSSEDGGYNNEKLPCSQCQFCKQTNSPSFFQLSPSPLNGTEVANNIIELSSDDCSSRPLQATWKGRASNQDSQLASKHCNNFGLHITTVAIKVEPSSSNAAVTQQWPADFYAIDIIDFFMACEKNPSTRTASIFHEYFPNTPYCHSTVKENCLHWKKAPQKLCDNILRAKRTDDGKWSLFQRSTCNNGKH